MGSDGQLTGLSEDFWSHRWREAMIINGDIEYIGI